MLPLTVPKRCRRCIFPGLVSTAHDADEHFSTDATAELTVIVTTAQASSSQPEPDTVRILIHSARTAASMPVRLLHVATRASGCAGSATWLTRPSCSPRTRQL